MNDTTPMTKAQFDRHLINFLMKLQAAFDAHMDRMGHSFRTTVKVGYEGRRYVRVDAISPGSSGAYCFIEIATGDLFKPASYRAPAKHKRGNIVGANPLVGCGPYGIQYLTHASQLFPEAIRDQAWAEAEAGPTLEVTEVEPTRLVTTNTIEAFEESDEEDKLMSFLNRN